jgi:hypothetical protein
MKTESFFNNSTPFEAAAVSFDGPAFLWLTAPARVPPWQTHRKAAWQAGLPSVTFAAPETPCHAPRFLHERFPLAAPRETRQSEPIA